MNEKCPLCHLKMSVPQGKFAIQLKNSLQILVSLAHIGPQADLIYSVRRQCCVVPGSAAPSPAQHSTAASHFLRNPHLQVASLSKTFLRQSLTRQERCGFR